MFTFKKKKPITITELPNEIKALDKIKANEENYYINYTNTITMNTPWNIYNQAIYPSIQIPQEYSRAENHNNSLQLRSLQNFSIGSAQSQFGLQQMTQQQ